MPILCFAKMMNVQFPSCPRRPPPPPPPNDLSLNFSVTHSLISVVSVHADKTNYSFDRTQIFIFPKPQISFSDILSFGTFSILQDNYGVIIWKL